MTVVSCNQENLEVLATLKEEGKLDLDASRSVLCTEDSRQDYKDRCSGPVECTQMQRCGGVSQFLTNFCIGLVCIMALVSFATAADTARHQALRAGTEMRQFGQRLTRWLRKSSARSVVVDVKDQGSTGASEMLDENVLMDFAASTQFEQWPVQIKIAVDLRTPHGSMQTDRRIDQNALEYTDVQRLSWAVLETAVMAIGDADRYELRKTTRSWSNGICRVGQQLGIETSHAQSQAASITSTRLWKIKAILRTETISILGPAIQPEAELGSESQQLETATLSRLCGCLKATETAAETATFEMEGNAAGKRSKEPLAPKAVVAYVCIDTVSNVHGHRRELHDDMLHRIVRVIPSDVDCAGKALFRRENKVHDFISAISLPQRWAIPLKHSGSGGKEEGEQDSSSELTRLNSNSTENEKLMVYDHGHIESLDAIIENEAFSFRPSKTLSYLKIIHRRVEQMHAAGIVHNSIAPSNIVFAQDGNGSVTLAFLGLETADILGEDVRLFDLVNAQDEESWKDLAFRKWIYKGRSDTLAPELLAFLDHEQRDKEKTWKLNDHLQALKARDFWSLGIVGCWMLIGEPLTDPDTNAPLKETLKRLDDPSARDNQNTGAVAVQRSLVHAFRRRLEMPLHEEDVLVCSPTHQQMGAGPPQCRALFGPPLALRRTSKACSIEEENNRHTEDSWCMTQLNRGEEMLKHYINERQGGVDTDQGDSPTRSRSPNLSKVTGDSGGDGELSRRKRCCKGCLDVYATGAAKVARTFIILPVKCVAVLLNSAGEGVCLLGLALRPGDNQKLLERTSSLRGLASPRTPPSARNSETKTTTYKLGKKTYHMASGTTTWDAQVRSEDGSGSWSDYGKVSEDQLWENLQHFVIPSTTKYDNNVATDSWKVDLVLWKVICLNAVWVMFMGVSMVLPWQPTVVVLFIVCLAVVGEAICRCDTRKTNVTSKVQALWSDQTAVVELLNGFAIVIALWLGLGFFLVFLNQDVGLCVASSDVRQQYVSLYPEDESDADSVCKLERGSIHVFTIMKFGESCVLSNIDIVPTGDGCACCYDGQSLWWLSGTVGFLAGVPFGVTFTIATGLFIAIVVWSFDWYLRWFVMRILIETECTNRCRWLIACFDSVIVVCVVAAVLGSKARKIKAESPAQGAAVATGTVTGTVATEGIAAAKPTSGAASGVEAAAAAAETPSGGPGDQGPSAVPWYTFAASRMYPLYQLYQLQLGSMLALVCVCIAMFSVQSLFSWLVCELADSFANTSAGEAIGTITDEVHLYETSSSWNNGDMESSWAAEPTPNAAPSAGRCTQDESIVLTLLWCWIFVGLPVAAYIECARVDSFKTPTGARTDLTLVRMWNYLHACLQYEPEKRPTRLADSLSEPEPEPEPETEPETETETEPDRLPDWSAVFRDAVASRPEDSDVVLSSGKLIHQLSFPLVEGDVHLVACDQSFDGLDASANGRGKHAHRVGVTAELVLQPHRLLPFDTFRTFRASLTSNRHHNPDLQFQLGDPKAGLIEAICDARRSQDTIALRHQLSQLDMSELLYQAKDKYGVDSSEIKAAWPCQRYRVFVAAVEENDGEAFEKSIQELGGKVKWAYRTQDESLAVDDRDREDVREEFQNHLKQLKENSEVLGERSLAIVKNSHGTVIENLQTAYKQQRRGTGIAGPAGGAVNPMNVSAVDASDIENPVAEPESEPEPEPELEPEPEPDDEPEGVTAMFTEAGPLGIQFGPKNDEQDGVMVVGINAGSQAENHDVVVPGRTLLSIESTRVVGLPYKQVIETIKAGARPITLTFSEGIGTVDVTPAPEANAIHNPLAALVDDDDDGEGGAGTTTDDAVAAVTTVSPDSGGHLQLFDTEGEEDPDGPELTFDVFEPEPEPEPEPELEPQPQPQPQPEPEPEPVCEICSGPLGDATQYCAGCGGDSDDL